MPAPACQSLGELAAASLIAERKAPRHGRCHHGNDLEMFALAPSGATFPMAPPVLILPLAQLCLYEALRIST